MTGDRDMERVTLEDVAIKLDGEGLAKLLHIKEGSEDYTRFLDLHQEALEIADPGALYKPVFIEERGEDYIVCDGVKLSSRVLAVNVSPVYRIFPFVATSGAKLEAWWKEKKDGGDSIINYWAGSIKGFILLSTINCLAEHIKERYATGYIARMNPGSIDDWPISEQKQLFEIIGDVSSIGVKLKDDNFMSPDATVSGLWFPSEVRFESCQLCPMEHCPGRSAPFDKGLFANKYGKTG